MLLMQTIDDTIVDEYNGYNTALRQQLWDMKVYHTFLALTYTYLTRNNYTHCSPNLVLTHPIWLSAT